MRSAATPDAEADPLVALERTASDAEPPALIRLLGDLERLKASLWQRLLVATTTRAVPEVPDPVSELRHLTPQQVGEILSLKGAYVHELCRTGRIPATKSGKYWMIPVTGLRRWLAYQNRDVDGGLRTNLESHTPGNARPVSRTSPTSWPRRPPMGGGRERPRRESQERCQGGQ